MSNPAVNYQFFPIAEQSRILDKVGTIINPVRSSARASFTKSKGDRIMNR